MLSVANESHAAQDDESDYGEITLEEQQILDAWLANNSTSDDAILSVPDERPLKLTDIEDYEDPSSIRLPRILGKELWEPGPDQEQLLNASSSHADAERTTHLATGIPQGNWILSFESSLFSHPSYTQAR